ncbi:hypothetical protein M0Q97_08440 [Candidatus Dojkabacteria bacterium]|jgi:hypothetical protein|nr:hypothetical protein [Candidatus Dojkabacteria bacterium]
MKILRKGNDFRKVQEKSIDDVLVNKNLINFGWHYCPKQEYKDFYKSEKIEEVKKDKKSKK